MASKNIRILVKKVSKPEPFSHPLTPRQEESRQKVRTKYNSRA